MGHVSKDDPALRAIEADLDRIRARFRNTTTKVTLVLRFPKEGDDADIVIGNDDNGAAVAAILRLEAKAGG